MFTGAIDTVTCPRIAVLGTDGAIGKRTTAVILTRALNERGIKAVMVGTGQTGLIQGARYGVALDAIPCQFCSGEMEAAVVEAFEAEHPDVIIIEGQGALSHPAYLSSTFILRGARPDAVILQHAPARRMLGDFPAVPTPTRGERDRPPAGLRRHAGHRPDHQPRGHDRRRGQRGDHPLRARARHPGDGRAHATGRPARRHGAGGVPGARGDAPRSACSTLELNDRRSRSPRAAPPCAPRCLAPGRVMRSGSDPSAPRGAHRARVTDQAHPAAAHARRRRRPRRQATPRCFSTSCRIAWTSSATSLESCSGWYSSRICFAAALAAL